MQFIAQKVFATELNRLRQLAVMTPYSYSQTREALVRKLKELKYDSEAEVEVDHKSGTSLKITTMLQRLQAQAPRYVRELVFTRAISALEVFLIDTVREIAKIAPEKFRSDEPVTFPRNQLFTYASLESLLMTIIEKECRQLGSGGFADVSRYYRNKLNIDFRTLTIPLASIEEYHDRRNLLVHKLGQTDEQYQHKYNTHLKKVSVDSAYLLQAIDDLSSLAASVNAAVIAEIFGLIIPPPTSGYRCLFVAEFNGQIPAIFNGAYAINHASGSTLLSALTVAKANRGRRITVVLEGDEEVVMSYVEQVRLEQSRGKLNIKFVNPKRLHRSFDIRPARQF